MIKRFFILLLGLVSLVGFVSGQLVLTLNTSGQGSISADVPPPYALNDVVTLTAEPTPGWSFESWVGVDSEVGAEATVTMSTDRTVTATFTLDPVYYDLTVTAPTGGTISLNPTGGNYLSGTVVTLTAEPTPGWSFESWVGVDSEVGAEATVTMNSNRSVSATFTQDTYTLTVTPPTGGSVSLVPSGGSYLSGTEVTLTATPAAGWSFAGWIGVDIEADLDAIVTMNSNRSVTATFTQDTYTLTVTPPTGGSISLDPAGGSYLSGTEVTLTATPAAGWSFESWIGVDSEVGDEATVTMNSNRSVSATFTQDTYTLTVTPPTGGSVSLVPSGGSYLSGTEVTITATPAAGWSFAGWIGVDSEIGAEATVTMNSNRTVTATFTQNTYSLTVTPPTGGSVSLDPSGGSYLSGTEVTLIATPAAGWSFESWVGVDIEADLDAIVTMNSNRTVSATFTQNIYALTVTPSTGGSVSLDPSGGSYLSGTEVTLTATPAAGWSFESWVGVDSEIGTEATVTMNSNRSVTANFTQDQYTLTTNTLGNGSITLDPDLATYVYGDEVSLTAVADPGWTFNAWSGDASGNTNPTSVTMDGNKNVIATFTQDTYTLTINTIGDGSVTRDLVQSTYLYGDVVNLEALAMAGWTFSTWSGDISGSANPTALTMYGDRTVTATFTQDQYTLTINTQGNGSVTPSPNTATYVYGDVVNLNALPDQGWSFSSWSGDASGGANPTTVTMYGNRSVTATFIQDIYPLTVNVIGSGSVIRLPNQSSYLSGSVVALTALANQGWTFGSWSGDHSGTNISANITMDGPMTITATFIQDIYTLSIDIFGDGSVTRSPDQASYLSGSVVNLEAVADPGWSFTNWSGDLGGVSPSTIITMDSDKTLSASFQLNTYLVYLQTNPSGASSAVFTPSSPVTVSHGVEQTISVTNPLGYRFLDWTTTSPDVSIDNTNASQTSIVAISGPSNVYANFERIHNLTVTASVAEAILSPSGTVVVVEGVPQSISVNEPVGYRFLNWTVIAGSANIDNPALLSTEVTLNSEDATVRANFERIYTLILESDLAQAVFNPPSPLIVAHGTAQAISVSIPEGYNFVNWSVTSGSAYIVDPESPATSALLTTGDVTIRANFELKEYQLVLVAESVTEAIFTPPSPITVQHGVSQTISVSAREGYIFDTWLLESGILEIVNPGLSTTSVTLTSGDATLKASYEKIVEVRNISIPNASMKIGDVISATITVSNDAGFSYSFVSGQVGGYPLSGFQRVDETTYLANFFITEGGNSYLANDDIPVSNLVISDGNIESAPYSSGIRQNSDLLDASLPVINQMTVASGNLKIGDVVSLNIRADGLGYSLLPTSTVNGISASESSIVFRELTGGNYLLNYTVGEGDRDVGAGEFLANIILVKPSGNVGLSSFQVGNSENLTIDAHPPLVSQVEVSPGEFGVDGIVRIAVTADDINYTAVSGTVVNGIALSSAQISFVERSGGLYELSYTVKVGDSDVLPGDLQMQIVLADPAGNHSNPVVAVESNEVEIYTSLPTAVMAGTPEVCEWESAALTVFLNGRGPWEFDLYNGDSTVTYSDIESSTYYFDVAPLQTTSYTILSVRDRNGVVNIGTGSVNVTVNENTFLEFINILSGYSVDAEPVKLEANVAGGVFSGPGVISATGYFDPGLAGTVDSPHILQYTYTNTNGCTSVASVLVFVLGAEGDIFIPSDLVCTNEEPFSVNASNTAGVDGSFRLLDSGSEAVDAITDHGDNTAEIDPSMLIDGSYTIEYEYLDETSFFLRKEFVVESVVIPEILNLQDTVYCQNIEPILLRANVEGAVFEGPGIVHKIDGYFFNPAEAEPGEIFITCTNQSENGCSESVNYKLHIRLGTAALFELNRACIPAEGGLVSFINTTDDKLNVDSWEWNFGDPSSGERNTSSDVEPSHMYSGLGTRQISLTATSVDGCVDTHVHETLIGIHPEADFSWISSCYRNETGVEFLNKSDFGGATADSLVWTFRRAQSIVGERIKTSSEAETVEYSFPSEGNYLVDLYAYSGGCSDSISKELDLLTTISLDKAGYTESFDSQISMWTTGSENGLNSWILDEPEFTDFEPLPGDNAWFTRLPSEAIDYLEESWIESPCFDFGGMSRPMIQMDILRSFIPNTNGAVLQYMDVVEEGWKSVGTNNPGIAWYNVFDLVNMPGGSSVGWGLNVFNPDTEWIRAAHDLDEVAGKSGVKFRIALTTTGAQGIGNQGFAINDLFISERSKVSVLEHFTNSSIEDSKSADDLIDSLALRYSQDVINLQYHMDYPGYDPMGESNPVPATTRSFYYGIPSVPFAVLDGGISEMYRYGFSDLKTTPILDYIGLGSLDRPKFEVDLKVEWKDDSLYASTNVICLTDQYSEYLQLYLVVFETSVTAYTGLNGDQLFRNVVLDMLPTPAGKLLKGDWVYGDTVVRTNEWEYQSYIEDIEDLGIAAFVQDRKTGQILQATATHKDIKVDVTIPHKLPEIHLYPNPARNVVNINLGSITEEEAVIRLLDINGRVVHNEKMPAGHQIYQLNIHDLVQGMYVLQWIESGQIRGIEKIIKTR